MDAFKAIAAFAVAYAAGSIPWGVVLGRLFASTDLTTRGSGGTGATNALRVLGWRFSLAVFTLDFMKGLLPVLFARWLGVEGWVLAVVGLVGVVGSCWSPWIGFRGGKGMSTGAGAAAGLMFWVLLVLPLMVLIVLLTRYVSLASLAGSVTVSAVLIVLGTVDVVPWYVIAEVLGITAIIVAQHRANIRRLLSGTERRFGEPASST